MRCHQTSLPLFLPALLVAEFGLWNSQIILLYTHLTGTFKVNTTEEEEGPVRVEDFLCFQWLMIVC